MGKGGSGIAFGMKARIEHVSSGAGNRKVSGFDAGTMEGVIDVFEVNLQKGLNEFLDFITDLWVHVVREAAVSRPPANPNTLFAIRGGNQWQKRLSVGWENYPSGPILAAARFEPIRTRWLKEADKAFNLAFDASIMTSGYSGNMARVRSEAFSSVKDWRASDSGGEKTSRGGAKYKRGLK